MKTILVSLFSYLIIILGAVILNTSPVEAGHAEWHEGPSCGQCHCEEGQDCVKGASGVCECSWPSEA